MSKIRLGRVILTLILVTSLISVAWGSYSLSFEDGEITITSKSQQSQETEASTVQKPPSSIIPVEEEPEDLDLTDQTIEVFIDKWSECSEVYDGDTIRVSNGDLIRLADITAPELGEFGYDESKEKLTNLILGKTIYLDVDNRDLYGRYVCVIYHEQDGNYTNINHYMVMNGYATDLEFNKNFNSTTWQFTELVNLTYAVDATWFSYPGIYIGDKQTSIYHQPESSHAKTITKSNEIWFSSDEEAQTQDYHACYECLPSTLSVDYVSGEDSIVFHYPSCPYVEQIDHEDMILFTSRNDAINSGRRPCQNCSP
jgi:endonuclease YncB( thermonuclease family)